jgi:tol-pal system protein YbgF
LRNFNRALKPFCGSQMAEAQTLTRMTSSTLRWASALAVVALVFLAIAAAGAGFSPARAQDGERPGGLFDIIFGGSERFAPERVAQPQAQPQASERATPERTAQAGAPDLMLRVDRLESQIRQLTGVIEQLQYRNQQLEMQVRRMQEEGDPRGALRGPPAPRPQSMPGQPMPGASPAAPRHGDAFDPTLNPNAAGAPHTLGTIGPAPARPGEMADASVGVPPPTRLGPTGAPATLAPSQAPKDEFDLAYGYVLRRDYVLAEESFRAFLSKYPDDRLAGDATFWFGESLFQRQRFRDAAEAFLNVSTKFEGNPKAPDALLRLGQSLAALGEKEAACASLGEVLRKFPRASAGVKQAVDREQKRVRC